MRVALIALLALCLMGAKFEVEMDDQRFDYWVHKTAGWFHFWGDHSDKKTGETEKEFALRKIQEETGMVIREVNS